MAATKDEIFAGLRKIDTPTITNVVATYPKNPLCLGRPTMMSAQGFAERRWRR